MPASLTTRGAGHHKPRRAARVAQPDHHGLCWELHLGQHGCGSHPCSCLILALWGPIKSSPFNCRGRGARECRHFRQPPERRHLERQRDGWGLLLRSWCGPPYTPDPCVPCAPGARSLASFPPAVDFTANVVRRVFLNGTIFTVLGNGTAGYSGDNGPGTAATIRTPRAVVSDGAAGFLVADTGNFCVRRWFAANGTVASVMGKVGCRVAGGAYPLSVDALLPAPCDSAEAPATRATGAPRLRR